MEIIEIKQKWPKDYLRIEFSVGDICNYQCWYCWPEAHAAEYKWPDYELVVNNISALLDYYIENTDKKRFEFCILGGEVTHWSKFLDFIKYFKTKYNCIFNLLTNGSKKFDWWKEATPYLDYVMVSHHQKLSNKEHNRKLLDHFYKNGVIGVVSVLMDPTEWDGCIESIEYYKQSKHRWAVRYGELVHKDINYTEEQKKVISKVRARSANKLWFLWNNKLPRMAPRIVYGNGKQKAVEDNEIVLQRKNNFNGWECNVGIDWIAIRIDGSLSGTCSNSLYQLKNKFNIYDKDFKEIFKPDIVPTLCNQASCWCSFESNMPKKKVSNNTQRIIPIYES